MRNYDIKDWLYNIQGMKRIIAFDVGIKNLAYCDMNFDDQEETINRLESLSLTGDAKHLDLLARSLFDTLQHQFPPDLRFDLVMIENQPVKINPVMKSIQMMIYSFFVMRHDKVKLVAASNKTKMLNLLEADTVQNITEQLTLSSKYANTKRMSILIADHLLAKADSAVHAKFKASKKKDDLADAYLMCCFYKNSI